MGQKGVSRDSLLSVGANQLTHESPPTSYCKGYLAATTTDTQSSSNHTSSTVHACKQHGVVSDALITFRGQKKCMSGIPISDSPILMAALDLPSMLTPSWAILVMPDQSARCEVNQQSIISRRVSAGIRYQSMQFNQREPAH